MYRNVSLYLDLRLWDNVMQNIYRVSGCMLQHVSVLYTLIHQISDTASSIPPCSTFWSHEHAKHSPNASTNHTKTNDNARALKTFARGQLKVLQMAVSAIGAAGPGSPDERRAWQVVLRRGQCHAAMQLRLRVAVSPRQCVVW